MSMERLVHINTHNGEVCFGCYCMVWHGMACCGMLAPLEDPCRLQMDRITSQAHESSETNHRCGFDMLKAKCYNQDIQNVSTDLRWPHCHSLLDWAHAALLPAKPSSLPSISCAQTAYSFQSLHCESRRYHVGCWWGLAATWWGQGGCGWGLAASCHLTLPLKMFLLQTPCWG